MLKAARICIQETDGVLKIKVQSEDERLRLQIKKSLSMPGKPGESEKITDKWFYRILITNHAADGGELSIHTLIFPHEKVGNRLTKLLLLT